MLGPFIVACVNLKGGVGKTAIAVNFAAYCGYIGMRTLLVDLAPGMDQRSTGTESST